MADTVKVTVEVSGVDPFVIMYICNTEDITRTDKKAGGMSDKSGIKYNLPQIDSNKPENPDIDD